MKWVKSKKIEIPETEKEGKAMFPKQFWALHATEVNEWALTTGRQIFISHSPFLLSLYPSPLIIKYK